MKQDDFPFNFSALTCIPPIRGRTVSRMLRRECCGFRHVHTRTNLELGRSCRPRDASQLSNAVMTSQVDVGARVRRVILLHMLRPMQ
jgi:hypothetical protein